MHSSTFQISQTKPFSLLPSIISYLLFLVPPSLFHLLLLLLLLFPPLSSVPFALSFPPPSPSLSHLSRSRARCHGRNELVRFHAISETWPNEASRLLPSSVRVSVSVCIPCARQIAIRAGRESCVIDALAAHEWNRGGARAAREAHSAFKYDLNRTRTETGCGGRVLTVNERENDPPLSKEPCTPGPVPPFYKDRNPLLFLSLFVYISSSFSLFSLLVGILVRLGWFLWHGGKDFSNFSPFPSFLYHFSPFVEFYFGIFGLEIWLGEYCNFLSLFSFSIFFSFFLHSFGISLRFD